MDGASRFTQRDAVASILITAINIIAGFLIGVFQHGMELRHALETYTVLTIGDGLVTVIPALMISVSGGLIVTRTGSEDSLGAEFQKQVLGSRAAACCWRRRADGRSVRIPGIAHHSVSACWAADWARSAGECVGNPSLPPRFRQPRRSPRTESGRSAEGGAALASRSVWAW